MKIFILFMVYILCNGIELINEVIMFASCHFNNFKMKLFSVQEITFLEYSLNIIYIMLDEI